MLIIGSALFLIIATLMAAGRLGDVFYLAFKNIKAVLFVALCLCVGAFAGLSFSDKSYYQATAPFADSALSLVSGLTQPPEEKVLARIRTCQAFVTAQLDTQQVGDRTLLERAEGSPSLLHLASDVPPRTSRDWDRCARTFGTNYWKYDISINGEHGGQALCKAYRQQQDFTSSEVEAWCDTVFASENKSPETSNTKTTNTD